VSEPFSKSISELREWDCRVWEQTEAQVPENSVVFAKLVGIHFDLLLGAHNRNPRRKVSSFERALRLMAARCIHILRTTWLACMTGYQGAWQPLVRALYETSLTMHYLRLHPEDFSIWTKRDKSPAEARRFWPSAMMKRLNSPEPEQLIIRGLAEGAHPNPPSLSRLGGYDLKSDTLEISVGQVLTKEEAQNLSADICLFTAISAYTIARVVEDALVDGLPNEAQLHEFLNRLTSLTDSVKRERRKGATVFDLFSEKRRR